MLIDYKEAAEFLRSHGNYYILLHTSPDGDAIGSGFGLCYILRKMGKNANVLCTDNFPAKYDYMYLNYTPQKFNPDTIISVDLADTKLLGSKLVQYGDYVELCIDHHVSNTEYAKRTLLEPEAAAAAQVIYQLVKAVGLVQLDSMIAQCLYTAIVTDTGCFKFSCTSSKTHLAAAELMTYDIPAAEINRRMFDIKSKARIKIEQHVLNTMEYYLDDKCAIAAVTLDDMKRAGLPDEEFEGMTALTTLLQTIEVGITIRQKDENKYKVSMRATGDIDVSAICQKLGGGGHTKAAGCVVEGKLEDVKLKLLSAVAPALGIDLWLA